MSLSRDPAFTLLQQYFICGIRDISNESYAGLSGRHDVGGKAIWTSNGAGPHNIQIFILSADGTVLTCLPGFWASQDLAQEMRLAYQLQQVWNNPSLSRADKNKLFKNMQLAHIYQHPAGMTRRSHMQSFDQTYEAQHRLHTSDTIRDPNLIQASLDAGDMRLPQQAFKTTDVIMHERMAARPFVKYDQFDVAAFSDYGKTKYDKEEDARDITGKVDREAARSRPMIGNNGERSKLWGAPAD